MPHPTPAHKSFSDRNSLYQEITDKIIAELEQGRLPWVQPWSNAGTIGAPLAIPRNAGTGRQYSGINILILWCAAAEHGFTTQSWLTFRQALAIGAHVKKGEKGTSAVYAGVSVLIEVLVRRSARLSRQHRTTPAPIQFAAPYPLSGWVLPTVNGGVIGPKWPRRTPDDRGYYWAAANGRLGSRLGG